MDVTPREMDRAYYLRPEGRRPRDLTSCVNAVDLARNSYDEASPQALRFFPSNKTGTLSCGSDPYIFSLSRSSSDAPWQYAGLKELFVFKKGEIYAEFVEPRNSFQAPQFQRRVCIYRKLNAGKDEQPNATLSSSPTPADSSGNPDKQSSAESATVEL